MSKRIRELAHAAFMSGYTLGLARKMGDLDDETLADRDALEADITDALAVMRKAVRNIEDGQPGFARLDLIQALAKFED